jgi:hypothetical protein
METSARRLAALFTIGLIALYSPILGAFTQRGTLFGVPILPLYLFAVWAGLVALAWALTRGGER